MDHLREFEEAAGEPPRRLRYFNAGFLKQRRVRRIMELAGHELRLGKPVEGDGVAVWGHSPYAGRGEAVAEATGAPLVRVAENDAAQVKRVLDLGAEGIVFPLIRSVADAERAVASSSLAAFPELRHVPAVYREFLLWREKGDFDRVPGGFLLPKAIASALGDQDGVYPSAARQYRESMNHVAKVCREKGLMDHVGEPCVPVEVSLIEALLAKDSQRFEVLQARDGYGG